MTGTSAKSHVCDIALVVFAKNGIAATSLRAIAAPPACPQA
jgi:hypothetical protein